MRHVTCLTFTTSQVVGDCREGRCIGDEAMKRLILALGAVLLLSGAAQAAPFAKGIEKGPVDNSLFCPAGSGWYPVDGGVCLSCPNGKKPVAGACPGLVKKTKKARKSYVRKFQVTLCKPGHFRQKGTKQCWTCGKGYVRIPGKKFTSKGHMCISLKPQFQKPRIVERVKLKELLDPKRLKQEFADRGCKGYGRNAFFALKGAGTCMTCPASHPKRTKWPASTDRACATKTCGGNGERMCDVLAGEGAPCGQDLQINLVTGLCEAKRNIACKPVVNTIKGMRTTAAKVQEAADKAGKIPGLDFLMKIADGITGKVDEMAISMVSKLPQAKIKADIDRIFGDPAAVREMAAVAEAIAARKDRLTRLLLDADTVCVNTAVLEREMMEILRGARRADAPTSGEILAELLGVGRAEAAVPPFWRGKSIAVSGGVLVNRSKLPNMPFHMNFALEGVWEVNDAGTGVSFSLNFIPGADIVHKPAPHPVMEWGLYVSFGGFGRADCSRPYALQLGAGKVLAGSATLPCGFLGLGINLAQVTLGKKTPAITLLTPENVTKSLLPAQGPIRVDRGRAGIGGLLGFNFSINLAGAKGQSVLNH